MARKGIWRLAAILTVYLPAVIGQGQVDDSACNNAFIIDGAGRAAVDQDCTRFIHCDFTDAGQTRAFMMDCPDSLFWNPSTLVCQIPEDVECQYDRCVGNFNGTYQLPTDTCAEYWMCIGERTFEKRCCGFRESYRAGVGCVPDDTCISRCPRQFVPQNFTGCDLIPHPTNIRRYIQLSPDGRSFEKDCAQGGLFDPESCECSIHDDEFVPLDTAECIPSFRLTFPAENTFRDVSGFDSDVAVADVQSDVALDSPSGDRGTVFFDGVDSRIVSRRFNFAEFGFTPKFSVTFREENTGTPGEVALITNDACDMPPSVELYLQPASSTIVGKLLTTIGEISVDAPYTRAAWNTAVLSFDGEQLSLDVNGNVRRSPPTGNPGKVIPVQCSLQIGYGQFMNRFRGHIDEVSITLC